MSTPPRTLLDLFDATLRARAEQPALRHRTGEGYRSETWSQYAERALGIAAGLRAHGVDAGDHVVLLTRNRPEFHHLDLACVLLGAIPVSVYDSPSVARLAEVLGDCRPRACVVQDDAQLERMRGAVAQASIAPRLVSIDADDPAAVRLADLARSPLELEQARRRARPEDTVVMLYTSGTTGPPKGVPLSHANVAYAAETLARRIDRPLQGMRQLSYLPMAHIGERLATHYLHLATGTVVTCCPVLAELDTFLAEVRPQFLFGAPRLWERLRAAVVTAAGGDAPELIAAALHRAGLDELEVAITGSAPMPAAVHRFWLTHRVPLADCYGQTETSGIGTWNPHEITVGTSGRPFHGVSVRIGPDGEIALRGPGVFAGYHGRPEATAAVLDDDGWYHSGDLGHLDPAGDLVVDGRNNDMLVPTSGHNVSPAPIEARLLELPAVSHAVVVGHARPYLAALLCVDRATPPAAATLDAGLAQINADLPGAERVRRYRVVTDTWTADDLLTATGKVRRPYVLGRYAALIDAMYESP